MTSAEATFSYAYAIDSSGQVGGYADTTGDLRYHAFLYEGSMQNVNALLVPGSGWEVNVVTGISDSGQIAANGYNLIEAHALLLTPAPEPGFAIPLLAGCGVIALRRRRAA